MQEKRLQEDPTLDSKISNNSLIYWYSKNHQTIESSVFGTELVALKIGVGNVRGLRYKMRTMGFSLTGLTYACGDNMFLSATQSD